MTLPSDTTLALISWLASRDTPALHTLVTRRGIAPGECVSFRTLAQALLHPDNIHASLQRLTRQELSALHEPEAGDDSTLASLEEWGFLSRTPEGCAVLIPRSHLPAPEDFEKTASPPSVTPASPPSDTQISAAATRALSCVVSLVDLVDAIALSRFPVSPDGQLSTSALKNLQAELGVGYDVPTLYRLARQSGLLGSDTSVAALTAKAVAWRELSDEERYEQVVTAWWSGVPSWLGVVVAEHPALSWNSELVTHVAYHYPLVSPEAVLDQYRGDAETLGLTEGLSPTPWARELWGSGSVATSFGAWRPPYAPGVFAHDDYTLLASGPLAPHHREILSSIAARELGGLVPRYRITAGSILNALQDGVSPKSIPTMLMEVCVNEIPAGMLALADDVARRALDLEIHQRGDSTFVVTRRADLSDELLSDPGLIVLGLSRSGESELRCSWPAERVHSTLLAASYPSLLMDSSGKPLTSQPLVTSDAEIGEGAKLASVLEKIVADAREAAAKGVPAGFSSIIDIAIDTKTPLEIVVRMPDDALVTVVMEPRALSAGRLRGVELKHAVEKTLPASRITSVRAWSEDEG